jgi:hypothetical protein
MNGSNFGYLTEGHAVDHVLPHVVGLSCRGMFAPKFLLDVELGIIMWLEPFNGFKDNPSLPQMIAEDPYDYIHDQLEAEWREGSLSIEVTDFFEMLKTISGHYSSHQSMRQE